MTSDDDVTTSPTVVLPLAEAASRLGLSVAALRSRIRRGVVTARRGNDRRLLVEVPADARPRHDNDDDDDDEAMDELLLEADALRAELLAALVTAARAEERAAAKDQVVTELRAQLEWHRQPWWKRIFG